ncbi:MAG: GntR family transcriptional regulator [Clostridium sp.]
MKQTGCQEYQKVLSYFYDLVKDGTLTWGSKLPTERKIAEQLGIGRNSAREAICVLPWHGLLKGSRAPAIMLRRISVFWQHDSNASSFKWGNKKRNLRVPPRYGENGR